MCVQVSSRRAAVRLWAIGRRLPASRCRLLPRPRPGWGAVPIPLAIQRAPCHVWGAAGECMRDGGQESPDGGRVKVWAFKIGRRGRRAVTILPIPPHALHAYPAPYLASTPHHTPHCSHLTCTMPCAMPCAETLRVPNPSTGPPPAPRPQTLIMWTLCSSAL